MKTNANILSFAPTTLLRQGNLIRGESKSSCQMALPAKKIDFERPFRFVVSSFNFMCLPSRSFQLFFCNRRGGPCSLRLCFSLVNPEMKKKYEAIMRKRNGSLTRVHYPHLFLQLYAGTQCAAICCLSRLSCCFFISLVCSFLSHSTNKLK